MAIETKDLEQMLQNLQQEALKAEGRVRQQESALSAAEAQLSKQLGAAEAIGMLVQVSKQDDEKTAAIDERLMNNDE